MNTKVRIAAIRLWEKTEQCAEYANRIGVSITTKGKRTFVKDMRGVINEKEKYIYDMYNNKCCNH